MVKVLDSIYWIVTHWVGITAGVLALDKIVTITPNPYDDMLITGAKWIINKVKIIKEKVIKKLLSSEKN